MSFLPFSERHTLYAHTISKIFPHSPWIALGTFSILLSTLKTILYYYQLSVVIISNKKSQYLFLKKKTNGYILNCFIYILINSYRKCELMVLGDGTLSRVSVVWNSYMTVSFFSLSYSVLPFLSMYITSCIQWVPINHLLLIWNNRYNTKRHQNFDYTTIANRLGVVGATTDIPLFWLTQFTNAQHFHWLQRPCNKKRHTFKTL